MKKQPLLLLFVIMILCLSHYAYSANQGNPGNNIKYSSTSKKVSLSMNSPSTGNALSAILGDIPDATNDNSSAGYANKSGVEKREVLIVIKGILQDPNLVGQIISQSERVIIDRDNGIALSSGYQKHLDKITSLAPKKGLSIERIGEGGEGSFAAERDRLFPEFSVKGKNQGLIMKAPVQSINLKGVKIPDKIDNTCAGFPEGFEGAVWVPQGNWIHEQDSQGQGNGAYFWQDMTCSAHTGSWSGEAILGGTSGGLLGCGSNYPDGLTCVFSNASIMYYNSAIGCIYGSQAAALDIWVQLNTELNADQFDVLISVDGSNYSGYTYSGLYGAFWYNDISDLTTWPILGNLTNYPGGFILVFSFCNDASVNYPFGARLDDINITYSPLDCTDGSQLSSEEPANNEIIPESKPTIQETAWVDREKAGATVIIKKLPADEQLYGTLVNLANRAVLDRHGKRFLGNFLQENQATINELVKKHGLDMEIVGQGGEQNFNVQKKLLFPELNNTGADLSGFAMKDEIKVTAPPDVPHAARMNPIKPDEPLASCVFEGFEGQVWVESGGNWYHWQGNKQNNDGKFFWIDDTCDSYDGNWQANAVRGGKCSGSQSCGSAYPANLTCASPGFGNMAWMKYKNWITCASGAPYAHLITDFKLLSEANFDFLRWLFSSDDVNFYGYQLSGDYSASWWLSDYDMKSWPTLGDITTLPQVTLAYTFCSDINVQPGFGAYLDDITLTNCPEPGITSAPDPPVGATVCTTPTLSWAGAPGAATYDVYIDSTLICQDTISTSCTPPFSLPGGLHTWYVDSKSNCGVVKGTTWSFTLDKTPPNTLGWNSLKLSKIGTIITLNWGAISDETGYNIYRDTIPNSVWGSAQRLNGSPVSVLTYNDSPPSGNIFFYILKAVDACGNESVYP